MTSLTFIDRAKELVNRSIINYFNAIQSNRINEAYNLYIFLTDNACAIKEYLKSRLQLSTRFDIKTLNNFVTWDYENDIPKMARILCNAYAAPPDRVLTLNGKENEKDTDIYNQIISDSSLNQAFLEIHKFGWGFGRIWVMPIWREDKKKLEIEILYPYNSELEWDETGKILQVGYYTEQLNPVTKKMEKFVIVWAENEHYAIDEFGNKKFVGNNTDYKNPYGKIPIACLKFSNEGDLYGHYKTKLVEKYTNLSIQSMWQDYILPLHIGGIPVVKNMNLKSQAEQVINRRLTARDYDEHGVPINDILNENKIIISPDTLLISDSSHPDNSASFEFKTPVSNIALLENHVNLSRRNAFISEGISPDAITMDSKAESGYKKEMDWIETIAVRESMIPSLGKFEKDFYPIAAMVLNEKAGYTLNLENIVRIDFREQHFPKSSDELTKERDLAIKNGTKNLFDFIIEDNPDIINYVDAEKRLLENIRINSLLNTNAINVDMSSEMSTNTGDLSTNTGDLSTNTGDIQLSEIFPDLRQGQDYSCGANCVQGIMELYGEDNMESDLIKEIGTTAEWGTDPIQMENYFKSKGLEIESGSMTIEQVKSFLDLNIPVILDIQAWSEIVGVDYANDYEDGHYVVAVGYDGSGVILEDPSSLGRAHLTFDELGKRWHDIDIDGNRYQNYGIAVKGEIKMNNKFVEIG